MHNNIIIHCFAYQVSLQKIPLEMASSQEKWNIRERISFSFRRHSICCLTWLIWILFTIDLFILNILSVGRPSQLNDLLCFMGVGGAKECFWCVLLVLAL